MAVIQDQGRSMLYKSADDFVRSPRRAVTVFGMAGVGKTRLSNTLRASNWFHYSADYRIGTRYMGEFIVDNFKHEAMKVPFLAELLRSDSIYISSNITFDNLDPLSSYLGRPGDADRGGLPLVEYQRRQVLYARSEPYIRQHRKLRANKNFGHSFRPFGQNLIGMARCCCHRLPDFGNEFCRYVRVK
jgi:hypothetical protein